jgi:Trypsin
VRRLLPIALLPTALVPIALVGSFALAGCQDAELASLDGDLVSVSTAVVDGAFSGPDHDAVVLVQYDFNGLGNFFLCSGVLVAPNVLATARHCVASWEEQPFGCDLQGQTIGSGGTFLGDEFDPANIKIYVGNEQHLLVGGVPDATGVEVFHDGGPNLCSHDVAFVLLDKAIDDVPLLPLRIGDQPVVDENISVVAWGDVDGSDVEYEIKRTYVSGIAIDEVGALEADPTLEGDGLPPRAFATGPALCQGDSGGPAIADTGAVVGIAANFAGPTGFNTPDPCSLATTRSIFMQLTAFEEPLREALAAAGQPLWLEGHAAPGSLEAGDDCIDDVDCGAGLCRDDGDGPICAASCAADSDCGAGNLCDLDSGGYCIAEAIIDEQSGGSGCSASPGPPQAPWWLAFALCGLLRRRQLTSS